MKKIVQINSVCNGSTGKIMREIQTLSKKYNFECICLYGRRKNYGSLDCKKISYPFSFLTHVFLTFIFNNHGMYSYFSTKRLVKILKKEKPDIIHLHNIHGYYLNYKILFKYLKYEFKGKVFWTLHDCWSFTGHCAFFSFKKCNRWKNKCCKCPNMRKYPISLFFDTSSLEYLRKKRCFNNINMELITPSLWLKDMVGKSYLNNYKVNVIHNGINLDLYKPMKDNDIYKKYNISNSKRILLGVANVWEERKGLKDLLKINDYNIENTQIVIVGLSKKQIKEIPFNIVGIERTDNQTDLAKIYSIADIFLNPTYEDNYPTTNIESIACGTPVLTYNTGGCGEQIIGNTGFVCKDFYDMLNKIEICLKEDYKKNIFDNSKCLKEFDAKKKYFEYIELYEGKL